MDKEGKTYIANLPYEEVWSKAEEYSISRGKMYRATYSIDKEAVRKLGKYSDVYPAFRRPFFRDVTALYTGSRNWTVALPDSLLSGQFREGDMVYLKSGRLVLRMWEAGRSLRWLPGTERNTLQYLLLFFWSVKPERYGSLFRKLKSRNWSCIGSAILL